MATIKFFTRTKVSKLAPVYIRFVDGPKNIDIKLATPLRMVPTYWNPKKQALNQKIQYTEVVSESEAKDIEDKFSQLKDVILRESYKVAITSNRLGSIIDKFCKIDDPGMENLNQYVARFITEATSGARLATVGNDKRAYSSGTLRNYRDFQRTFDLYQKERNKKLNYEDITMDFYNDFIQFFYARRCGANYIGKHLRTLKTILRQARDEGKHSNTLIDQKAFKAISGESDSIYLTQSEIDSLYNLDLSGNKHLEVARDVFLCGCYTAQRYSDYSRFNKDMIKSYSGNKVIEFSSKKTRTKVIIPIKQELDAILKKYNYILPKTHEQKVNKYIKIAGKLAGIKERINHEQNKGGLTLKTRPNKYKLIQTHTARRTGCTLMYLAGIPIIDIMKISGHRSEKVFLKYIKVSKEETAVNLASHPYFNNHLRIAK